MKRTRAEAMIEWSRESGERERQKAVENWKTLEEQLTAEQKQPLMKALVVLNWLKRRQS